jgi:hypothetical protein
VSRRRKEEKEAMEEKEKLQNEKEGEEEMTKRS